VALYFWKRPPAVTPQATNVTATATAKPVDEPVALYAPPPPPTI
jgi:hypothetical protein